MNLDPWKFFPPSGTMPGLSGAGAGYRAVGQQGDEMEETEPGSQRHKLAVPRRTYWTFLVALAGCLVICLGIGGIGERFGIAIPGIRGGPGSDCPCRPPHVPQYFQTSPELWAGPTATGKAPFLAQTATFEPTATYVPNEPLRTAMPIEGMGEQDEGIFKMMGFVSRHTLIVVAGRS